MDYLPIEEVYTPKYCSQLEAAYGKGMLSEGGETGIEYMFDGISLNGKVALDLGFGLGGIPFYLAEKYAMQITGLEVNPWAVEESTRRIPEHLKNKLHFDLITQNSNWAIPDKSMDIIYSRGAFSHVEFKDEVFREFYRILKHDGLILIYDCVSREDKKWGKDIARLVELEHLPMYPESESGYLETMKKNGFALHSFRDDTLVSIKFNREIIQRLQDPLLRLVHLNHFTESELQDAIEGYESIVSALKSGELRIVRFLAYKN
jgi:phosphoethanolamine N-methyltransferase